MGLGAVKRPVITHQDRLLRFGVDCAKTAMCNLRLEFPFVWPNYLPSSAWAGTQWGFRRFAAFRRLEFVKTGRASGLCCSPPPTETVDRPSAQPISEVRAKGVTSATEARSPHSGQGLSRPETSRWLPPVRWIGILLSMVQPRGSGYEYVTRADCGSLDWTTPQSIKRPRSPLAFPLPKR